MEKELRIAKAKGELIPRSHVLKQATFLVISLRQRLLSIADQQASELLNISDEREMNLRLDSIVRDALSEISDMPLKVVDENWLEKLDGNEASKRPRRATSSASTLVPQGAAFSRPG